MWDALLTDARHSLRGLRRSPGFTVVVVLTLALAIGATTTIGSLLNAVELRTVSLTNPARILSVTATDTRTNQPALLSADAVDAYRAVQRSLSAICLYTPGLVRVETERGTADAVSEGVTPDYFDLVGTKPSAGRFFTSDDGPRGAVVVISSRFRRRAFGDRDVVGTVVNVEGRPATIVGVTAPGFEGLQFDSGADIFLPLGLARTLVGDTRTLRARYLVARLRPGVTMADAAAELRARWSAIAEATLPAPASDADRQAVRAQRLDADSLAFGLSGLRLQYGSTLRVLIALSGILLVLGCLNLAGLLLARSIAQRERIAVRLALGASRGRIVRQVLLDGVLLALGGLVAGLPLTWWTIRALTAMVSVARATPLVQNLGPDARVLGVAAGVTLGSGLAIGILPAWRAASATPDVLHSSRTAAASLGRTGRLLLVAQVALSMVLLVGAGLFTTSLSRLRAADASGRARPIVWTRLARTPGDRERVGSATLRTLVERLEAIAGADAAALSVYYPAFLGFPGQLPTDRYARADGNDASQVAALTEFVSPGFFRTFDIARLRGRDFTWADDDGAPAVVVIGETLARRVFGGTDAVGRRLRMFSARGTTDFDVVGVVADAPIGRIRDPHQPVVFRPIVQEPAQMQTPLAHVRVAGDLAAARQAYVGAVQAQGRFFVRAVFTRNEWLDHALLQERLIAGLATFAGVLTVALACIGVYSLLSYAVSARTRELGVRVALGATQSMIMQMVMRDGVVIAVCGVVIGIPCAVAAARLVRAWLFGIGPGDPWTIAAAAVTFVVTCAVASVVPAIRASTIAPIEALRQE